MALTKGNPHFPVMLLQNPVKDHDTARFEDMVNNCKTLRWLEDVLDAQGLALNDVIILDVLPLLSDFWLSRNTHIAKKAIEDAYALTERILLVLKPRLLISCQRATKRSERKGELGVCASSFANSLASSTLAASQRLIMPLRQDGHDF